MIYLDEDARDYQIKICQTSSDNTGILCPKCNRIKAKRHLCPLGMAWLNPLEGEQ